MNKSPSNGPAVATPTTESGWARADTALADANGSPQALASVCRDYWPPLYGFVRRRGYPPEASLRIVAGFVAELLAQTSPAREAPAAGGLRAFLLASLKYHLFRLGDRPPPAAPPGPWSDEEARRIEAAYEQSRPQAAFIDEDQLFAWRWAEGLVGRALAAVEADFAREARGESFDAWRPFLAGGVGLPGEEATARRLGRPVEGVRAQVEALRRRYGEALRAEAARTVNQPGDVARELHYLLRALGGAHDAGA